MLKLKNVYRWRYSFTDQNKENFSFRKVAHLEFTLYGDFCISVHGNCATFQKNFFLSKAPSVCFKIKLIKGLTILAPTEPEPKHGQYFLLIFGSIWPKTLRTLEVVKFTFVRVQRSIQTQGISRAILKEPDGKKLNKPIVHCITI